MTGEPFADYHDLKNDLDFWHDYTNDGSLYLCSVENPGKRFDSIKFNYSLPILSCNDIFQYGGRKLGIFFQSSDTSSGRAWMKYSVNAPEVITKSTDDRFWIAEE